MQVSQNVIFEASNVYRGLNMQSLKYNGCSKGDLG